MTNLDNLRQQIDIIDDELIALFKKRMDCVHQVGALKKSQGEVGCMIRPAREATMMRTLMEAGSSIFSGGIIYAIWRAIIAGSTQQEAPFSLSIFSPDDSKTSYWLAREYFGGDTPCRFHRNTLAAVHEVASGSGIVGIFPLSEHKGRPWWVELLELPVRPSIFALLPFVGKIPFETDKIVALSHVPTEPTGNDITVAVVVDSKSISRETIQQHFAKNSIPSRDIMKYEEGAAAHMRRYQLFLLEGFYTQETPEIASVIQSLNVLNTTEQKLEIHIIGQYAAPLTAR